MWMAVIDGWTNVQAFSSDKEKAKQLAVNMKMDRCCDDLTEWTWQACEEYYGAWTEEITEDTILVEMRR